LRDTSASGLRRSISTRIDWCRPALAPCGSKTSQSRSRVNVASVFGAWAAFAAKPGN